MSGAFERHLAEHLAGFLESRPPQPGQILLAQFHRSTVADQFAEALVESVGKPINQVEVENELIELPAYHPPEGVPTYLMRVRPEVTDETPASHVVSQGFATKMRNLIADSVHSANPYAMLMIIEADATIDTLEASEELFSESGPINLDTFRNELFDITDLDSPQGRAFLRGLQSVIVDDPAHVRDINVLETLTEIRLAVERQDFDQLPALVEDLPQFIHEDFFGTEEFKDRTDEESLEQAVSKTLRDNKQHANTLRRAHDTGTDTRSRLLSSYTEEFVDTVLERSDWSSIPHSDVRRAETTVEVIRFDRLEVEARRKQIFDPLEKTSKTRKGLVLVPDTGKIAVTAVFIKDVEDTPYECINSNGDEIGNVVKRTNRVTATLDGLNPDRPHFAQFLFYVGKQTTRGKPTHQFDIAVVPEWFYHATEDLSLDIDVAEETFLAPGDQRVSLIPPERLDFQHDEREVAIEEDGQTVEFKGPLTLDPDPPGILDRVTCQIAPPEEIPISLTFLIETTGAETEDVILPMHLAAIADKDEWAGEQDFMPPDLLTVDTNRGAIYTASEQGINLRDEALELLQIEEHIINEGDPRVRLVDSDSLGFGSVDTNEQLPEDLMAAYDAYFTHLEEREVTPSTDRWDDASQALVEQILDEYERAVFQIDQPAVFAPYRSLKELGTIRSGTADKLWHTPFHPISLAYGLRIARWRDEELVGRVQGGFRREEFVARFNPTGLLPYRSPNGKTQELLRGQALTEDPLWQVYSTKESPGSVTPTYMERVVRDKLFTFVQAFPTLFKLHPERQLVINLINLGDLRSFIKGLYEFYNKVDSSEIEPPTILLRIYGGDAEGEALDRFFTQGAKSRLLTQLEKRNDEIVDLLRRNVRFVHAGPYTETKQKPGHLTFFRGLLREEVGTLNRHGELPSGMLHGGLFPRESIDVGASGTDLIYTVGFSADHDEDGLVPRIAKVANSLEAGAFTNSYNPNSAPKKNVQPAEGTDIDRLWEDSLWVIHVQPNVGIEFYLQSEITEESPLDKLMIHYSDQYDASSPNFDVITSTDKRRPYEMSLQQVINDSDLAGQLDPELVLSTLVAVDGELALKLQRATDTEVVEYIGFVGGLALSRSLLNHHLPEHVWIPINLQELTRHDRAYRSGGSGLLETDAFGKSSDDLCFVGVPTDPTNRSLKLWIVETKGGTSRISTGRDQVEGAIENLRDWFVPPQSYADERLLYGEFGKIILDVARRMHSYGVMDHANYEAVNQRWRGLLEGEFDVNFLKDSRGHIGEVVRIRSDRLVTDLHLDHEVRAIEAPLSALELLEKDSIPEVLPDLSINALEFHSEPEVPIGSPKPSEETPNDEVRVEAQPVSSRDEETLPGNRNAASEEQDDRLSDGESEPIRRQEEDMDTTEVNEFDDEQAGASADRVENGTDDRPKDTSTDGDDPISDIEEPQSLHQPSASEGGEVTTSRTAIIEEFLDDLEPSPNPEADIDSGQLASDLMNAFNSLGIDIHHPNPSSVSVGPRKIGIDIIPKEGQKVESILRNLDSLSIHIKAQGDIIGTRVPAKGAVHLEIPHGDPRDIYLREGLASLAETHEIDQHLQIPLGVDTDNVHHTLSLLDERHLLVGGATGSGKSNFLGTVISSLAITEDPGTVKLSILDPKGVDFGQFADLPHVEAGGYFDSAKACTEHLLSIVETEVEQRQQYLSDAGVTSVAQLYDYEDRLDVDPLPFHVIVIDEYADLTMSVDDEDELEEAVTRLAQIGRALGIVVILATQRPSADIVSGKIKANFPCRISFRLPSNTDSRVILDEPGAEDLQGSGDMIVKSQSGVRLHLQAYYLTPIDMRSVVDSFGLK